MKSSTYFLNKTNYKSRFQPKVGQGFKQDRICFNLLMKVKDFTKLNSKLQKQVIIFLKKENLLDCITIPYYFKNYKIPVDLLR